MSRGIASPSTVRNANRSQKATVLDSQNRWSGRTGSRATRRLDEGPADAPRLPVGQHGDRRQLARAGPVDADLGARDDRATLVGDEEPPPVEVANNKLTALPREIGHLAVLTTLVLASNQLMLPLAIGQLTALKELDARGNELTALPRV